MHKLNASLWFPRETLKKKFLKSKGEDNCTLLQSCTYTGLKKVQKNSTHYPYFMLLLKQRRAPKTAAAAVAFRLAINARWGGKVIKTLNEHFETTQFGAIYEWQYTIYCNWAFKLKWTKQHSAVRNSQGCLFCQILFNWFSFMKQFSQTIQMYWTLHLSFSLTPAPQEFIWMANLYPF